MKRGIALTAVALAAAIGLAGCGSEGEEPNVPEPTVTSEQGVMGSSLYRLEFNEGTKCYVVDSYKSGALSCDFSQSTTPSEGPAALIEKTNGVALVRTSQGDVCAVFDGYQASGLACRF